MSLKSVILNLNAEVEAEFPLASDASREEKMLHIINVLYRACLFLYANSKKQSQERIRQSLALMDLKLEKLRLEQLLRRKEKELDAIRAEIERMR